jgi:hypothetical protein
VCCCSNVYEMTNTKNEVLQDPYAKNVEQKETQIDATASTQRALNHIPSEWSVNVIIPTYSNAYIVVCE